MAAKDHFKNEDVEKLLDAVRREMEKLGLYMENAGFASDDSEDGPVFLQAMFLVGEQAFSEKVLNPEQDEFDRQFEAIAKGFNDPTEEIRQTLKQSMQDGRGILDLGDD